MISFEIPMSGIFSGNLELSTMEWRLMKVDQRQEDENEQTFDCRKKGFVYYILTAKACFK